LKLDQLDVPGALLLVNDGLESDSGIAVPATSIMKENVYFFHVWIVTYA
jgi:hypothetical protein